MKQLGLFRMSYPHLSETFIAAQAANLQRYVPLFLLKARLGELAWDSVAVSDHDWLKIREKLYYLSRSPRLFPQRQRLRGLDLIHAHFGFDAAYALPLAQSLGKPLVVTYHGTDVMMSDEAMRLQNKAHFSHYLQAQPELKRYGAAFITVSKFLQQRLLAKGYPSERVLQHYVGVDTGLITPLAGDSKGPRYILSVARHVEVKGVDTLLRAFALIATAHPDVRLLQVGAGPDTPALMRLAQELGIAGQVDFLGAQPHARVRELMQHAEIFAHSSQTAADGTMEALGIVLNEASACAVPIVCTRHGGMTETVVEGETGLLAAERDYRAMAAHFAALLSDRALSRNMGLRGREFVCDCFDLKKQTKKLELIYDSVAS